MQEPFSPHIDPNFAEVSFGNAEIAEKKSDGTIYGGRSMPGQVKVKGRKEPVRGWIRIKRDSKGKPHMFFKPFAGQDGVDTKEVPMSGVTDAMELQFNSPALARMSNADKIEQTPLEQAIYPDAKRYSLPMSNTEKQANIAMEKRGADDYLGDPPTYDWATGLQTGGGSGAGEGQDVFPTDNIIGFNFFTMGHVYVVGTDKTPTWTEAQIAANNVYITVSLDNGDVDVVSDDADGDTFPDPASWPTDTECYAIVRDGVRVQNSDIHVPFLPYSVVSP